MILLATIGEKWIIKGQQQIENSRWQKWGKWLGMIDEKTLKPQYGIMAAYAGLLLGLVLLVISLFGGF